MKKNITLFNPIMVDGKQVKILSYDANEITAAGFIEAEAKRKNVAGRAMSITPAAEFDFGLHLYLGFAAIIAVNSGYDYSDLERIKGNDVVAVMGIGRNFMLKSEEDAPENESEEPSETTQGSTTQASQSSKKSGSPTS